MQIHELNNFTGTLGSGAYLAIDDGTDTGKISSQGLLAATEARIDNIIAGPAPSAEEIVDARLGADGVTYPSLGDAIRDQFTDVKSDLNLLSPTAKCIQGSFKNGYIDGNAGAYTNNSHFVTSKNILDVSAYNKMVLISNVPNTRGFFISAYTEGTWVSNVDITQSNGLYIYEIPYNIDGIAINVWSYDSVTPNNSSVLIVGDHSVNNFYDIANELSMGRKYIQSYFKNGYIDNSGNYTNNSHFITGIDEINVSEFDKITLVSAVPNTRSVFVSTYLNGSWVSNSDLSIENGQYVYEIPSNIDSVVINIWSYDAITPHKNLALIIGENNSTNFYDVANSLLLERKYIKGQFRNGYIDGSDGSYTNNSRFITSIDTIDVTEFEKLIFVSNVANTRSMFISAYNGGTWVSSSDLIYARGQYTYEIPSGIDHIAINVWSYDAIIPNPDSVLIIGEYKNKPKISEETPRAVYPYMPNIPAEASSFVPIVSPMDGVAVDSPAVFWDSIMRRWGMVYTEYLGTASDTTTWHGRISAAHSYDLENWVNDGAILDREYDTEGAFDRYSLTGGYVVIKDDTYYVYYVGSPIGGGYERGNLALGLATGKSLDNLTKYADNPILSPQTGKWYRNKIYKSHIIKVDGVYYNFFNAQSHLTETEWVERMGFAISEDLINWAICDSPLFQAEYKNLVTDNGYKHFITGDPSIYDIGDNYFYMDLFSAFNETINWGSGGTNVSYARTRKKDFPFGWEIVKDGMSKAPYTKSFVMYRGAAQYKFFADMANSIYMAKFD